MHPCSRWHTPQTSYYWLMMLVHLIYQREATYLVWSIPQPKKKTLIINQQVIHLAKEEEESRICILYDGTDVFVLLVNLFSREQIKSSMTMESPIHGRSSIKNCHTTRVNISGKLAYLCTKWIQLTSTAVDILDWNISNSPKALQFAAYDCFIWKVFP